MLAYFVTHHPRYRFLWSLLHRHLFISVLSRYHWYLYTPPNKALACAYFDVVFSCFTDDLPSTYLPISSDSHTSKSSLLSCFWLQLTSRRRSASRTGDVRPVGRPRRAAVVAVTAAPTSRPGPSTQPPDSSSLSPGQRRHPDHELRQTTTWKHWTLRTRSTTRLKSMLYCSFVPGSSSPCSPSASSRITEP